MVVRPSGRMYLLSKNAGHHHYHGGFHGFDKVSSKMLLAFELIAFVIAIMISFCPSSKSKYFHGKLQQLNRKSGTNTVKFGFYNIIVD